MGVRVRQKVQGKGKPWWVFIAHHGKRRSTKVGDKRAAEKFASEIRLEISRGKLNLEPKAKQIPTFGEYSDKWLQGYIKAMRRISTYERYEELLRNHILPVFADKPMDKITRGDIRDFIVSKTAENYARSTVCLLRDVISGVFNYAIDEEVVQVNPVSGITKRLELNRTKKPEVETLNRKEVCHLLDTCQEHYPDFHPFFLMGARTGMRLGELLAIRWSDIDFNSGFIAVKRSYRRGCFSPTKTSANRRVDMSNQLAETLKVLLTQQKREALSQGSGAVREVIFHNGTGTPFDQNHMRRVFKRILKKAKLRDCKLHILRHTFASLLLTQGESPVYVKDQLGHSSIHITVDIYGHLLPGANKEAVNKLDDSTICTPTAPTYQESNLTACYL